MEEVLTLQPLKHQRVSPLVRPEEGIQSGGLIRQADEPDDVREREVDEGLAAVELQEASVQGHRRVRVAERVDECERRSEAGAPLLEVVVVPGRDAAARVACRTLRERLARPPRRARADRNDEGPPERALEPFYRLSTDLGEPSLTWSHPNRVEKRVCAPR